MSDNLAAYYAVNATGALRRLHEAIDLAELAYPAEPPAEWASALGHLRVAVKDMGRALDIEDAA